MNCDQIALNIEAYLDGVLSEEESPRLTEHVATCSRCSARYAALLRAVAILGDLSDLSAPDELIPDVLQNLPAYRPGAIFNISPDSIARVEWALGLTGAVSTAAIIVALVWVVRQVPAWWNSLGAVGRVLAGLAVKCAVWAADAAAIAAAACGEPLMYGLLIDIGLLGAIVLVLMAWRKRWSPKSVVLTL